ncbi:MAG: 3-phosphoserine/phosphohydroxythreonine transaminase [Thermodesulfobacteriota bacterium]
MMGRVHNFSAGPAVLPVSVLEEAQKELLDYKGVGMSIMEMSHRSQEYEAVQFEAESLLKELLSAPNGYRVLFLGGGAHTQFAAVPLNFLFPDAEADYVITGGWAERAYEEALKLHAVTKLCGKANMASSSKATNFDRIPTRSEIKLSPNPAYVHITSNNTLYGTQWPARPDFGKKTLFADMSSDFLSRPFDLSQFALIYAGAQKNCGPAGVTIVVLREDMIEKANKNIPTMLSYGIHAKNNSRYNTPPVFSIYMVSLVLNWLKNKGGLAAMKKINVEKAGCVYEAIDNSGGFYQGHARKDSRSMMNITFRLPTEELENKFVDEARKSGLVGLKGHRSVGGIRASTYNALPIQACRDLASFMGDFQKNNG